MNKKLLFAAISLAALTACNSDDFESQQIAEQAVSPIKFEVLNNSDAQTRASMGGTSGTKVVWNANDGDLFTLYHGAAAGVVSGFENACYKAEYGETKATLSTPTMIKEGRAIMVWPVDTNFRIKPANDLTLTIPVELKAKTEKNPGGGVENAIPYVSDLINIGAYNVAAPYNTAGKDRLYPVYMRPMASILTLKADWANKDKIDDLTKLDEDPIAPITLTNVKLMTEAGGGTEFTSVLPIKWTDPTPAIEAQWDNVHTNRAWEKVTDFDVTTATGVGVLTTECIDGTKSAKFIILPQDVIAGGVVKAAVDINTYYGRVFVATDADYPGEGKYSPEEYAEAWYRYVGEDNKVLVATTEENASSATAEADGDNKGKYETVAKSVALGMQQTINFFSDYKSKSGVVEGEPTGTAVSRYVKVNLDHLDMSNLHIKDDKQLRDVVRVWDKLGLAGVTVYLDGDDDDVFEMTQKTIKTINDINKDKAFADWFKVMPCDVLDEECATILITGGGDVQDVAFIADNGGAKVDVVFNAGETWKWNGAVKVENAGVTRFINKGTLANAATATLQTTDNAGNANNVPLRNNGTWNITAGTLTVQFTVSNTDNGVVNISKGAQYRQDETALGAATIFYNWANAVPTRFKGDDTKIGVVVNKGVFAAMNTAKINNYGVIQHADKDAKTFITSNQSAGALFTTPFGANKMGMIQLPYDNKDENNISISAAADQGFVAVVVDAETAAAAGLGTELNNTAVGEFVNYIIINGGIETITNLAAKIKYVEIADKTKEIVWKLTAAANYDGLMVLSDVNITLGTEVSATTTYLGDEATMYVGGTFNKATTTWAGYYGDTSGNVTTNYVYFGGL